jgi:hypothetical protein
MIFNTKYPTEAKNEEGLSVHKHCLITICQFQQILSLTMERTMNER